MYQDELKKENYNEVYDEITSKFIARLSKDPLYYTPDFLKKFSSEIKDLEINISKKLYNIPKPTSVKGSSKDVIEVYKSQKILSKFFIKNMDKHKCLKL